MPLLEKALSNVPGIKNLTTRKVAKPTYKVDDFVDGFVIHEFEAGQPKDGGANDITLKGPFMPHTPFKFGGEQRLVKEYYPGNSEPTVHVLGPKESDLTISGELKLKRFKRVYGQQKDDKGQLNLSETQVRAIAQEYQELIDAMRIRGNLVQMKMGEWQRWGFIEKVDFEFDTLAKIKYSIQFFIVGFNKPLNTKISRGYDDNLTKPNTDLTNKALLAIAQMQNFPTTMPQTLVDFLNGEIGKVGAAISLVTGFVNEALSDVEQLNQSVNRALGLIKNARAVISSSARRLNFVANDLSKLGTKVVTEVQKTKATILSVNHVHDMRYNYYDLAGLLASLSAQFSALRRTVPLQRHLVKTGDTLQKISSKYYNTPDNWREIYDHNKLTSTALVLGSVLEIPKL